MICSRAMGALVMMRDEPFDAPIPDRFEPSSYHADKITQIEKDLAWCENMADSEAEREAEKDHAERCATNAKCIQEANDQRALYESMLDKVMAWNAQTADHEGFKKFMVDQITQSMQFDCNTKYYEDPPKLSGADWRIGKINKAHRDLAYHKENHLSEVQRTEQRNEWLRQLRDSLKGASA